MTKKRASTREEVFAKLPKERQAELLAIREKFRREHRPMFRFRALKVLIRQQLETQENYTPDSIRQFEKHTDLLLSIYREVLEAEGGTFKVVMNLPNHDSYDLFHLRDLYAEIEGTPLGPFYEEEDINEINEQKELLEVERKSRFSNEERKIAA